MNNSKKSMIAFFTSGLMALALSACGGGGGSEPPAQTFNVVSGTVTGATNVAIAMTGAAVANTTAGAGGNFSFSNVGNGSSVLTPSLVGFTFSPASRVMTMTGANVTNQNFTATAVAVPTYCLTGTVNGAVTSGVTMTLAGPNNGSTLTNTGGAYSFCGLVPGVYTVTPTFTGYSFTSLAPITITTANVASNNFTSAVVTVVPKIVFVPVAPMTPAVVGVAYNRTVVQSVSGGQTPYHYQLDTMLNGAPPMGMIIDLNGNLTGTPSVAGTYTFGVCAVDVTASASSPCPQVSVTVQPALTASLAGTGSGSVVSTPAGIACGATCKAGFASGSSVTLVATADASSTFTGWSGACTGTGACVVTMSGNNVAVTATFTKVVNTCSNGALDYPTCTPPPTTISSISPSFVTLGKAGSCTGGTLTGSFSVKAGSTVTWKAAADSTSLGGSTVAVTATAASGNGTVNFTITVPPQAPSSGFSSCSLTYNLAALNMIWVTFSDGASLGFEVYWTFVGVT